MISFKVTNGQRLVQVGRTWIGADTSDQRASFTVNSLFTGALTAYFGIEGLADVYPVTLDASNECTIPAEVLVTSNMPGLPSEVDHVVNVSIQDSETTTSIARFPVFKTTSGDNKPPVIPDSDAYDNLLAMIPNAGSVSGNSMIFTNGNKQLFIVDVSSLVGGSGSGSEVIVGVSSVNGQTGAVTIDLVSLGGEKAGTALETVAYHNSDTSAHADIRSLIQNLSAKISNFLDSDDTTLDQLSELITYIKSNKDLIDYVTTNKVNVTDIVNDLNTDIATQPLSAAQGVALRRMIESVTSGPGTGEGGGYYIPSVDAYGNLTWTPSKAGMPEVPAVNIEGPKGDSYTLTEEDKSAIANSVLAALPTWTGGEY